MEGHNRGTLRERREERSASYSPSGDLLGEGLRGRRHLGGDSNRLLFSCIALLFLLASCGGGGGGGGGGGQGGLSVELALTPGNGTVMVNLVEKGPLVRLLNISSYQLTAIDSANETMRIEGENLDEELFNGSTFGGLTNDHNYTFALRVFYFPVGSAELFNLSLRDRLSDLSLRIDYVNDNARNIRDAGGITVGSNRDSDYLADLVDLDDDSDGVNDLDTNGMALDNCPRGELNWQRNETTDIDGDGCRDETEDVDDDNDGVNDLDTNGMALDKCPRGELNWLSNEITDNDGDGCRDESEDLDDDDDGLSDLGNNGTALDACPRGDIGWLSSETTDHDGDGCRDEGEDLDDDNDGVNDLDDDGMVLDNCPRGELDWQPNDMTDIDGDGCRDESEDRDDDDDGVNDGIDSCPRGELNWLSNETTDNDGDGCRDSDEDEDDDNDNVADGEDLGQFNGKLCRIQPDCDGDGIADGKDSGEFMGTECYLSVDCDKDGTLDSDDVGEYKGVLCRVKPGDCDEDTIADELDVDADGDGLIEIGTAAELDAVRWVLNGSGQRLSSGGFLNQTGCGNGTTGGDITECGGYELIRDVSLAAYANGSGWVPLGSGCSGAGFSSVFDGNGFVVSDMYIDRRRDNCVGLFARLMAGAEIRNLIVRARSVIGRARTGGLVGEANDAKIVSSYLVAGEISTPFSNSDHTGGLVGYLEGGEIVSSFSVAGSVGGKDSNVGGLVGYIVDSRIVSSSSVTGEVRKDSGSTGGLIGYSSQSHIVSSYSVAGEVRGSSLGSTGGLVGWNNLGRVSSSYTVAGRVRGGFFTGPLVGFGSGAIVSSRSAGDSERELAALRVPTNENAYDAGSIYANWANGADIDGETGAEDITIYCDEDLSGGIETAEMRDGSLVGEDDNRIWDFGGADDYPAIRCLPLSLMEQRSWWFINNATNRPQINQDRLDRLTSP